METFVVRIRGRGEHTGKHREDLQGYLQLVGSSESSSAFRGAEELIAMIRAALTPPALGPRTRTEPS